jgi:hypothetical protein
MTIETARALFNTTHREPSRPAQTDHTYADQLAPESRMLRLRPRRFLRTVANLT